MFCLNPPLWARQSDFESGFPASSTMPWSALHRLSRVLLHAAAGSWCGFSFSERPLTRSLLLLHAVVLSLSHWINIHLSILATIFAAQFFLTTVSRHLKVFFFFVNTTLPFESCYSFWLFLNALFFSLHNNLKTSWQIKCLVGGDVSEEEKSESFIVSLSLFFPLKWTEKSIIS